MCVSCLIDVFTLSNDVFYAFNYVSYSLFVYLSPNHVKHLELPCCWKCVVQIKFPCLAYMLYIARTVCLKFSFGDFEQQEVKRTTKQTTVCLHL